MVFSAKLCFFRYLLSQYDSFIDRSRIGVNGVSYGGYVAGMMLSETSANHSSLLKCGVAVCPVVDWRYYGIYIRLPFWTHFRKQLFKKCHDQRIFEDKV